MSEAFAMPVVGCLLFVPSVSQNHGSPTHRQDAGLQDDGGASEPGKDRLWLPALASRIVQVSKTKSRSLDWHTLARPLGLAHGCAEKVSARSLHLPAWTPSFLLKRLTACDSLMRPLRLIRTGVPPLRPLEMPASFFLFPHAHPSAVDDSLIRHPNDPVARTAPRLISAVLSSLARQCRPSAETRAPTAPRSFSSDASMQLAKPRPTPSVLVLPRCARQILAVVQCLVPLTVSVPLSGGPFSRITPLQARTSYGLRGHVRSA